MKPIIVMADVVASRKVYGEQTQALLRDVVSKVNQHFHDQIESYFTITLGDEFQGLVQSVESAVSIMIYIEELLVSYQTMAWYDDYLKLRYVVSDGQINSEIHHDIAYEMNGLGLTAARAQLEDMKKSKQRFQISLERDRATAQFLTDFF
ncbi:MAG: hypothetical protein KA346_08110, partial [Neisseriaceae bacterium]|nr:hypothetical protein [Neisseriaceae bacterium]